MKRPSQSLPSSLEQPQGHAHVPGETPDLLLTHEAAAFVRFDGPHAVKNFFAWADRWGVPRLKRGRTCLWQKRVLIDFLERKPWTKHRVA